MRLYYFGDGETVRLNDEPTLTATGREQAYKIGQRLLRLFKGDLIRPEYTVACRASTASSREMAAIALTAAGLQDLPTLETSDLADISNIEDPVLASERALELIGEIAAERRADDCLVFGPTHVGRLAIGGFAGLKSILPLNIEDGTESLFHFNPDGQPRAVYLGRSVDPQPANPPWAIWDDPFLSPIPAAFYGFKEY